MKKDEKALINIEANKELMKKINKDEYYTAERFLSDAKRYIKAIKDRRMLCNITAVSKSGMSRRLKFLSCEKNGKYGYGYQNYNMLFGMLGFRKGRDFDFIIYGCGMDMVFHTNYTIIHRLGRLGMLNKKEVEKLAQMTPIVI